MLVPILKIIECNFFVYYYCFSIYTYIALFMSKCVNNLVKIIYLNYKKKFQLSFSHYWYENLFENLGFTWVKVLKLIYIYE